VRQVTKCGRAGLDDEDVILDAVKQNLAQAERKLQKTIRRIEAIPYMAVRGKNDIERGEKRRAIAQSLGAEKKEREEYVHACVNKRRVCHRLWLFP